MVNFVNLELDCVLRQINDLRKRNVTRNNFVQIETSLNKFVKYIPEILHVQGDSIQNSQYQGNLINKIIYLIKLRKKISQLEEKTSCLSEKIRPVPLHLQISIKDLLKILTGKIDELETKLVEIAPMPIKYGNILEKIKSASIPYLLLKSCNKRGILFAEKEFFHMILSKFSDNELKEIDYSNLKGNAAYRSLLSLLQIINVYINDNPFPHLKRLHTKIEQALLFSQKILAIDTIDVSSLENSLHYYNFLKEFSQNQMIGNGPYQDIDISTNSKQKAIFKDEVVISFIALVSDLCWHIKNMIENLQFVDYGFFNVGTWSHCVTIEISRSYATHEYPEGEYIYKIFNTGLGVNHHKRITQDNLLLVKPFVIRGLNKQVFSIEFIKKLVLFYLTVDSKISDFYRLHDEYLIRKGGGIIDHDNDNGYFKQLRGICSYRAPEACIFSHLNQSDIKKIELIKAAISVKKQIKIIEKKEESIKKIQNIKKKKRKRLNESESSLKRSKLMLGLAEKSFVQATDLLKDLEDGQEFIKNISSNLPTQLEKLYNTLI